MSETDTEVIVKLSKYIYDNSETKPTFPEVRAPSSHVHLRLPVMSMRCLALCLGMGWPSLPDIGFVKISQGEIAATVDISPICPI